MTPSHPSPARARALVVGQGEQVRDFTSLLRRHVSAVSEFESLYDALAEVGLASAREPVSFVVVAADCDGFEMGRVVGAFRRADPVVPVVVAVRRGETEAERGDAEDLVAEAIAEDFEHSILLPTTSDELARILGELGVMARNPERTVERNPDKIPEQNSERAVEPSEREPNNRDPRREPAGERNVVELVIEDALAGLSRARSHAPAPAAQTPAQPDRPRPQPARPREIDRTAALRPDIEPMDGRRPDQRSEASARPGVPAPSGREPGRSDPRPPQRRSGGFSMPAPPPSPPRDGPPGDIDLVRAVLENADLHAAALRVLRHHLGTADVRFVAASRPGEEEAIAVDRRGLRQATVAADGHAYGVLISATLDDATLAAWATWLSQWLRLDESHRELRRFAWTDELTGAGNRRAFETVVRDAMAAALAERRSISLMCLDIDDFKRYNDQFGHHAGDEVLRETAELLRTCVRAGDHVFRIGGDEFVVLFCDTSAPRAGGGSAPESVEAIARRFQRAINDLRLPQLGRDGPGTVTVSAGVAVYPWEGQDPETLLRKADSRALESKRNGKNLITFGPGAPDAGTR